MPRVPRLVLPLCPVSSIKSVLRYNYGCDTVLSVLGQYQTIMCNVCPSHCSSGPVDQIPSVVRAVLLPEGSLV